MLVAAFAFSAQGTLYRALMVTGFVLLRWAGIARGVPFRRGLPSSGFGSSVREAYRRWRMKRLRKKFEAYYDKRSGGSGPGPIH